MFSHNSAKDVLVIVLINNIFFFKLKYDENGYTYVLQLYSSMDFGRKWNFVHDNVMPGRFYWYD